MAKITPDAMVARLREAKTEADKARAKLAPLQKEFDAHEVAGRKLRDKIMYHKTPLAELEQEIAVLSRGLGARGIAAEAGKVGAKT